MFIKLNPTKIQPTIERLKRNGIDIQFEILEDAVYDVTNSGVQLTGRWTEKTLATVAVVQVSKNCVAVELNPCISELCGYQPGGPTYLHPGTYGSVEFYFGLPLSEEVREAVADLPWICELHLVPVTFLPE